MGPYVTVFAASDLAIGAPPVKMELPSRLKDSGRL